MYTRFVMDGSPSIIPCIFLSQSLRMLQVKTTLLFVDRAERKRKLNDCRITSKSFALELRDVSVSETRCIKVVCMAEIFFDDFNFLLQL
jgi:hypothetical protein